MNFYPSGGLLPDKRQAPGYPTFILSVLAFLYGILPLIGVILYYTLPRSPEWLPFLKDLSLFRNPWYSAGTILGVVVLYGVWLKKIPHAWIWVHVYLLTSVTSALIIWISETRFPVPIVVTIAVLLAVRALYARVVLEPVATKNPFVREVDL